ncbi:MAG: DDE-type integrase/transposase/recombinase [Burkholderiales bacterium]|nr:DDE-type integrase/transposase/recombinase [Burkholderiales bacterium]
MSILAYLSPNMIFKRGPAACSVKQLTDQERLVVESSPGQICTLSLDQFLTEYMAGHIYDLRSEGVPFNPAPSRNVLLSAQWDNASPKARQRAERAFTYVTAVEELGPVVFDTGGRLTGLLAEIAARLNDPMVPSRSTFFGWYKRFCRAGRSIEALLPIAPPRGLHRRRSRLPPAVVAILESFLQEYREGRSVRTGEEWVKLINAQIAEHNSGVSTSLRVQEITVSTWNRRLKEIDAFTRTKVTRGKRAAELEHAATVTQPDPRFPLQIVEVDHTRLAIDVYDPVTNKVHREVWMTTLIDRKTRMVLGFTLHIARHDHEVAAKCYAMAVLPKLNLRSWCPDAKNDWPCYGIMTQILCDNGTEFLHREFGRFCTRLGTNISYAPVYTPTWKGAIERYHRTIKNSLIKRLSAAEPGPSAPSVPAKRLKATAAATLDELTAVIGRWLVDFYHQEPHSALGMSPQQAWQRSIESIHIPLIASVDDLLIRAGRTELRTLTRQGIELAGDFYQSAELAELLAQIGTAAPKVSVVYHVQCAARIFVNNPLTDKFIVAVNQHPGCRPEYSRSQWQEIKRAAKEAGLDASSPVERDTAAAIVEAANAEITQKRRAKSAAIARKSHNRDRSSANLTNPPLPAPKHGRQKPAPSVPLSGDLPDLPSIDDLLS